MKSQVLANFHLPILTCIALLIFIGVFVGAIFWINRRGSKPFYDQLSEMPLRDLQPEPKA
jgi:cbb3-type cytochrome oxidase subunit 3